MASRCSPCFTLRFARACRHRSPPRSWTTRCAPDSLAAGHGGLHRALPRGAAAGRRPGAGPARCSSRAGPATGAHPHRLHPRFHRVGPRRHRRRSPHPDPRRLSLARRLHRPSRAGELSGPRRHVGGVLPRRPALRRRRRGQPRGGSRALLHQLPRPDRGRAVARPAAGLPLHPAARPASRPARASRIARGDGDFARYEGSLERRFTNGVGFAIAGDYLNSPTASGTSSSYSNTQFWLQGNYIPIARIGLQYQLVRSSPEPAAVRRARDPLPNDTIGPASMPSANRRAAPGLVARRDDGIGPRIDAPVRTDRLGRRGHQAADQSGRRGARLSHADLLRRRLGVSSHPVDRARRPGHGRMESGAGGGRERSRRCTSGTTAARNSDYVVFSAGLQPVRGLVAHRLRAGRRRGRRAGHRRRHRAGNQRLRGRHRVGARAARPAAGVHPHRRVQPVRLRRVSPHRVHRPGAGDRLAHGAGPAGAAPLDDAGGLVQRSARCHARGHPPDPFDGGGHAPIEVPAPVSQRDLRPQAAPERGDRGAPG